MDGLCLLAARLQVRADAVIPNDAKSAPVRSSRGARGDPVKGPQEGRQSEGVWKTAARGSLSRRNGNTTTAPGEARLSRALPNRFFRSGEQSCLVIPVNEPGRVWRGRRRAANPGANDIQGETP